MATPKKEAKIRTKCKQEENVSLPPPDFQVSFSASYEKVHTMTAG